jgi:3-hydroxyisobutyrate dehydrogenase-like beta-hydroxyacid dehydrogenase
VSNRVLRESPASSRQLETKGPKMITGDLSPQARLLQHPKDLRLMLAAADQQGVALRLTDTHRRLLEDAEALGHGNHDNSAIFQAMRESKG